MDDAWRIDVRLLGALKVQGARLDGDYMQHMAAHLGVGDLLARAIKEAKKGQIE
jgi:hypothetical protein